MPNNDKSAERDKAHPENVETKETLQRAKNVEGDKEEKDDKKKFQTTMLSLMNKGMEIKPAGPEEVAAYIADYIARDTSDD